MLRKFFIRNPAAFAARRTASDFCLVSKYFSSFIIFPTQLESEIVFGCWNPVKIDLLVSMGCDIALDRVIMNNR